MLAPLILNPVKRFVELVRMFPLDDLNKVKGFRSCETMADFMGRHPIQ